MNIRSTGTYVDATLGGGGHAVAVAGRLGPEGRFLGLDRDPAAVARCEERLSKAGAHCVLRCRRFSGIADAVRAEGWDRVDGVLLDLGISSDQLDPGERGFSFDREGPLDMRMTPGEGPTAAELLEAAAEDEIARVLREFGEERLARRIARAIARERARGRIETTAQLAGIVANAVGGSRSRRHPATKTFQALRIWVNGELDELDRALPAALSVLSDTGRMAVISFHSLEDRRVKQFFRRHVGWMESLQAGGEQWRGDRPRCRAITRKPVTPSKEEAARNPRARSAKLRVIERSEP